MPWDITVAGTVSLDDVTTPAGRRHGQLGGSAVYFALAVAGRTRVHVSGCVGTDAPALLRHALERPGIDATGIEVVDGRTRRWRARHDFDLWLAVDEVRDEGVYDGWRPRLTEAAAAAPILFVGSMDPLAQQAAVAQSSARLIGSDSMTGHIADRRAAVAAVAEASDVLFLNRTELAGLCGRPPEAWRQSAASLCGRGRLRAVVVKAGPLGAALVTAAGVLERRAVPVTPVVDPTGAGDCLAGGFLTACALAERDDAEVFPGALDAGLGRAAEAIGAFGTEGLDGGRRAAQLRAGA